MPRSPVPKRRRIAFSDFLSIANLLVGLLIGVAGSVLGYRALRTQEEVANKSGDFDKPSIQMNFAGLLSLDQEYDVAIGARFDESTITVFSLPISLESNGQNSVEDVYVQVRYHQAQNLAIPEEFLRLKSNMLGPAFRRVDTVGPFVYSTFHFDKIHPGVRINLGEPVMLKATHFVDQVTAKTLDEKDLTVKYAVEYSFQLGLVVAAQNLKAQDYTLSLRGIRATDLDDLIKKAVNTIENDCLKEKPATIGERIFGSSMTIDTRDLILLYPERSLITKDGGVSLFDAVVKSSADIAVLTYPAKEGNVAFLRRPDGNDQMLTLNCR